MLKALPETEEELAWFLALCWIIYQEGCFLLLSQEFQQDTTHLRCKDAEQQAQDDSAEATNKSQRKFIQKTQEDEDGQDCKIHFRKRNSLGTIHFICRDIHFI